VQQRAQLNFQIGVSLRLASKIIWLEFKHGGNLQRRAAWNKS
jgi:hypothetical protein